MGRKKKEEVVEAVEVEAVVSPSEITAIRTINRLDIEFGREDLNLMRDKINELIKSHC